MGEPLAHLVGHREFWSLQLEVNRHVLVPRPETELLVERVLALASERRVRSVLDLGTGSGAIALAIASELPHCAVVATDCSAAALSVARRNARNLDLQSVDIRMGDWFQAVPGMQFDVIVSNPPYVSPDDPHLRGTDLRFEPQQALLAAENGLADIRKLVNSAGGYLESGGVLLLEHGCDQGENVRELLRRGGFGAIKTCRDLAGLERVTLGHGVDGSPR
jgi:release factor glutamine methyltransferase